MSVTVEVATLLMVASGAQLSLQAPVNAGLARATGGLPAALISFAVGTGVLAIAALAAGELDRVSAVGDVPLHDLVGGAIGATYVVVTLLAVPSIGAGGVAAGIITGQLISSVALDALGAFGLDREPATATRVLAAALLALGTYAIVSGRPGPSRPFDGPRLGRRPAIIAVVVVGGLTAAQAPINADLAERTGDLGAALVNFLVGLAILAAIVVATRSAGGLAAARRVPRGYLAGGIFGAVNILAGTALVRTIGAGGVTAALVTGQLLASVALDRVGALGLQRRALDRVRVAGIALLGVGTYLIVA